MNKINIDFNRFIAKLNFQHVDSDDLKSAIEDMIIAETGLTIIRDRRDVKEILNHDGSLEIQKQIVGEAIAFLDDESSIFVRLIQHNTHGTLKFVYTVRITII